MKTKAFALLALLTAGLVLPVSAKDKKEKEKVTFLVSMTCESCQKRIEKNIAFEKGVTDLEVNLPKKLVTIEYRTDKTSPEELKAALQELGYTAMPFKGHKGEEQKQ